jgi:hypothetical protein
VSAGDVWANPPEAIPTNAIGKDKADKRVRIRVHIVSSPHRKRENIAYMGEAKHNLLKFVLTKINWDGID